MELGPGGLSAPQGAAGKWRTGPGTATAATRAYAAALWVCAAAVLDEEGVLCAR